MSSELDGLCCPLTLEVFEDPCILTGDGHTYERSSIQAWLDSGKLTSPTTGATLGIGGTRLVPNYAVKRTIAELAARGRLPPKGTAPRLATEVSQLAAAAEVLSVQEEPLPPPPPSDSQCTAQFSERAHGFADKTQTASQGGGFSEKAQSASQGRQGFSDGGSSAKQKGGFSDKNPTVRGGAKFGMGKAVDSRKGQMVGQFQESGHQVQEQGHAISDKSQSFSEGSGRTWFGWRKKERKAGPRGRALEAVEQKVPEESSEDDEPLEHACDALLVGGALRGGGSLAADGAFGTLTADGTSKPEYHSLKSNARTDAKVLKLCAPPLNAGMVLTCGQTRGVSAFKWKDSEVTTAKESGKWWKMKSKATTSRKRCWEKSGELKGSRDWCLCLASDARGSYAVAGCRGGDLKLWRPPKAETSGINRWVEAGVAERSHDSSRMRSDVRAVAVDDNSDTLVSGGTDWCVRLWDARTLRSKGALGAINRADNPDADENYDDDQRGHNYPVTTVDIRDHMIVSGGEDKRVMLWDCRATEGAVACLNRMAPVTVVKFVGKEHELLVAGEYGIAEIIDLRTHQSVTTLMKPEEWDAKTKENEGVWEGQLKNQHPILDACVSPTGDRVSILAWRPVGGVVEVFDAESWSLVSQVNLATELPRISPSSLAACRLPAGGC